MKTFLLRTVALVSGMAFVILAGCNGLTDSSSGPKTKPATPVDAGHAGHDHADGHHDHGAGPHDGTLSDWGGGKYHVEFTVDHDKKESIVYVLDGDENSPFPIQVDTLLLSIEDPEFQVELKAKPLEGEPKGRSSRFVGTHDSLGIVKEFQGTISGEVDGTPYFGKFQEQPHTHD
jgi:hypothetical protein